MSKGSVCVGLSGGVDSAVAAWLLKREGYDVTGVTLKLAGDVGDGTELSLANDAAVGGARFGAEAVPPAFRDAAHVAAALGIPYKILDFSDRFREKVMDYFIREYEACRTPNPCIACNRYIKWQALGEYCDEAGLDFLATGHYARILRLENGRFSLANAADSGKDQTYALYGLSQRDLSRTLLPNGSYSKEQIRAFAREAGLPVAEKKDSQEICFIPDKDYAGFIERTTGRTPVPGNFVNEAGEVLGRHKGLIHYTIGQRRGLGLPMGRRIFVKELRPDSNEVVLGEGDRVFSREVKVRGLNFMGREREVFAGEAGDREWEDFGREADGREREDFGREADDREREDFGREADGREREDFGREAGGREREAFGGEAGDREREDFAGEADGREREVFAGEGSGREAGSAANGAWARSGQDACGDSIGPGGIYIGKIRYGHKGTPCRARLTGPDEMTVTFLEEVRAVTKGQALVLYKDGCIAAGGTID